MTPPNSDSGDDIPETHNYTEAVGTRLTPKTKRRFDEYTEREELGNSEALRRLVRAGLDADTDDRLRDRLALSVFAIGVMGYPAASAYFGLTGVAITFIAIVAALPLLRPHLPAPNDLLPWRD